MNALELTAFGLFGIVLSLATTGLSAQVPYMSVAGGGGIPIEDVLLATPEPRFAQLHHPQLHHPQLHQAEAAIDGPASQAAARSF